MNLGDQLKDTLTLEAEMTHATRPPDIEGLIGGGRARRRRRNTARAGITALAVAVVGLGGYGLTALVDGDPGTAPPAANRSEDGANDDVQRFSEHDGEREPGTYRKVVGYDGSARTIEADLTFGEGWDAGGDPLIWNDGRDWALVFVYQAAELPEESGCVNHQGKDDWADYWNGPGREASSSGRILAAQLADLPDATLLESPQATEAFGYPARHLSVRILDRCGTGRTDGVYAIAADTTGERHGISYSDDVADPDRLVVIDFLVVDVDGVPIVVAMVHHLDATEETVARATDLRDSIRFVTSG